MEGLANTSRLVADELRRAERSINIAARDTPRFLVIGIYRLNTGSVVVRPVSRSHLMNLVAMVRSEPNDITRAAHPWAT